MTDRPPSARIPGRRRQALIALGVSGAVALSARAAAQVARAAMSSSSLPACMLTPRQGEGPYFVDEHLNRADIRSDPSDGTIRPGAPLTLRLRVASIDGAGCQPVVGANVDVWHCDAAGIYSDTDDLNLRTKGARFLRGYQVTDADGIVRFTTIYPGWYPGRAVHVHLKVRAQSGSGQHLDFTSQLYFDDALTDRVHAQTPYAGTSTNRRTRNIRDDLYRDGGDRLQLAVTDLGGEFTATYDVGLKMS